MALCDKRYSATQFALLSSAMTVAGRLFASSSGIIVDRVGWTAFFVLTASAVVPALLLLAVVPRSVTSAADV
jgi:MFS transporter, PAT family, beta-lactamase induction signal transducer AmpG